MWACMHMCMCVTASAESHKYTHTHTQTDAYGYISGMYVYVCEHLHAYIICWEADIHDIHTYIHICVCRYIEGISTFYLKVCIYI